ncbi:MAG: AMP-binding protein, partial [Candidatus Solibacter sp.]
MRLGPLFHATAGRVAAKTALICGAETVSYAELDLRSRGVAAALLARGVRRGDRVGIHSTNSIEAVTMLLACFHAGFIAVPVNVRLKAAEAAYILGHAQPVLCYSHPAL